MSGDSDPSQPPSADAVASVDTAGAVEEQIARGATGPETYGLDDEPASLSIEEEAPPPTYVPAALAMGIMMLLWGILTNWLMSLAGSLLMVWAIKTWIREIHRS